ncbi:MAG: universal stress protein [Actinomycetes bacterium]
MDTKEIVVGLNGSISAALALRWAVEEARLRSAPLRIVHAWQLGTEEIASATDIARTTESGALEQATGWITAALGTTDTAGDLDIVEGPAGPVLVARSHQAALLVVGTQEHLGLRRVVAGSISHHCLSHAACPVVAVPGPAGMHRHVPRARHHEPVGSPGPLF